MKRGSGRSRRKWKIIVIVEGESDRLITRGLATAAGIEAEIDAIPTNGISEIRRVGERLIRDALKDVANGQGCVAVLVDRDGRNARRDEPHKTIRRYCAEAGVAYVEASETIEAWCLADPGISSWLGLSERGPVDRLTRPKERIKKAFAEKTRRPYQARRIRRMLEHASGVDPSRSPSWRKALEHLRGCGLEPST